YFIVLIDFQKRTPCMYLFGGGCSFANGLSSHSFKSTLTKRLSLINATKFDRYQGCLACAFSAFRMRMVIKAVQICIITAFSLVPMKDFMCNCCFMSLKKISTSHLAL